MKQLREDFFVPPNSLTQITAENMPANTRADFGVSNWSREGTVEKIGYATHRRHQRQPRAAVYRVIDGDQAGREFVAYVSPQTVNVPDFDNPLNVKTAWNAFITKEWVENARREWKINA